MKRWIRIGLFLLGLSMLVYLLPVLYWQFILTYGNSDLDVTSNQIIFKAGKKLREKYGLYPQSFGGSCVDEGITSFALGLHRYGLVFDRDEARELVLECTKILHKIVNEDESVRKFLIRYPFPIDEIHISIYSSYPTGYEHHHPGIGVVSCGSGRLQYSTVSPEDRKKYHFTSEYEESYEEAVEIVQRQRMERRAALGVVCTEDEIHLQTPVPGTP